MAEVEKKKKVGKLTYAAVGILGITVLSAAGFMLYGVMTSAKKETSKRVSAQQVNPAYVPPEKVAQAIPQPKKPEEEKAEIPPPPVQGKGKGKEEKREKKSIPAGRKKETWNIPVPPPSGQLQVLPKPEKPALKNPFALGFPKPSRSSTGLFQRKPEK